MLDDGKSQTRSADSLGVAFVDTVKAFKNAVDILFGYSDTCIAYGQLNTVHALLYAYRHPAVFTVVFHGIVAKVEDHFLNYFFGRNKLGMLTLKLHCHLMLDRRHFKL